MGAVGLALAVGRLLPVLLGGSHRAYALLGAGYGLLGVFLIAYALFRARHLQKNLRMGADLALDWWALVVVTAGGLVLAVATLVMVAARV